MNIDRVELFLVEMPLVAPFETSFGVEEIEEHIIIRAEGEGITGWGECVASSGPWYSYETNVTAWHVLTDFMLPALFSAPLERPQDFPERVGRVRGHPMAKAGLEGALWDWQGKASGKSLATLFGATRDRIPVGVSIGLQASVEALLDRAGKYLAEGYGRIKIKIKPGKDIELVRAMRERFPDLKLQVDANSAYRLSDVPLFVEMDRYDLLLIEQPLSNDDIYQHSILQRELKTPICLDESIHSVDDALAALELGACRIINIKAGRVGGFSEAIKIHDLCAARAALVWCGGMLETGIGRAGNVALAALPGFSLPGDISASRRYYREDLVEPEFIVDAEGTMAVPRGAGLGVEVKTDRLRAVTSRHAEFRK